MKKNLFKLAGLVISAMLLGACSQLPTFENEDLLSNQEAAAKNGFNLTPYGMNGQNVRTVCGVATTKNARRLTGNATILATDYGDIIVSNDQTNLYIEIIPVVGLSPSRYSYFLGDETSISNNGGLNTAFDGKTSQSSYTIPLLGITTDVDSGTAGHQVDLAVIFEVGTTNPTRYWAEGTQFTNITLNQQGNGVQTRYFTYTIQTNCPVADCYGPEQGSWTEGFDYNPGKNFSEYSSLTALKAEVKLQAGATQTHVGNAKATEYIGDGGVELVSITITLLNGYVFGDESFDDEGNLLPGSIFVQPFSQANVDNGTIPGLQNNNNPAPGQFEFKFENVTGTTYTISGLPKNDYYGIKTAVQEIIECSTE